MPLVVLSGQPASGKSTVAAKLQELLHASHPVHVVDEPSLHLDRNTAYQSSVQEKATRGALKSAVERAISKKTVVVLDSLNNIKGYRYELWCIARAAGTRYVMVHIATPTSTCSCWNQQRPEQQRYSEAVFNDLAGRFETPDARNRWDSPLFTILPAFLVLCTPSVGTSWHGPLQVIMDVLQVTGTPDEDAVLAAVAAAATGGAAVQKQQPPAAPDGSSDYDQHHQQQQLFHQGAAAAELKPTIATTNPALMGTNLLHEIDRAAQEVINRVMEAQQLGPATGSGTVVDLAAAGKLQLDRHISLAELRRHKRAFLKLATKITFSRLQDAAAAQRLFVDYLRQQEVQQMATRP